jgi:hypothetical protein
MSWWTVAANYDYGSLAGTYVFRDRATRCVLRLRADQTYTERVATTNGTSAASGTWWRFGEAGTELSSSFLRVPGQRPGPSGENFGHFEKILGVFPTLTLDPYPGGPEFRRTLSSFFERK